MKFEVINLGTESNPQNINLGTWCTPIESDAYIKLFREFKDVFAWTYDDLKTFDTQIMQHSIPLKENVRPYQQKLRKFHPDLEPQMKKELEKPLVVKIIFPVRHTEWVANLVHVQKKNGDIWLCVDFRNLNRASRKDNYPVPPMEQILQKVARSEMFSLLDGFSG